MERSVLLANAIVIAVSSVVSAQTQARIVNPFPLSSVTLLASPFKSAMDRTCSYLLWLDKDRMLYTFRRNYNLSTQGAASFGGWETPNHGLRGHTMGHILTGLAQAYLLTGDNRYKAKADSIVTELRTCQNAAGSRSWNTGYLSAWTEPKIDSLLAGTGLCPWAPLYCMHKTIAGMLDCYNLLGNSTALTVATAMGDWVYNRLRSYTQAQREAFWNNMCWNAGEYGGWNESMANLYALTANANHMTAAKYFDHARLFTPCLNNQDQLNGLHANTQVPKIIGSLRIFENTGEINYWTIPRNFWDQVIDAHTYINGGNSDGEFFQAANAIASRLSDRTCETCNIYNMLKLSRLLFFHTPLPKYMDYSERALYNQILASQNPGAPHGHSTYFQPMRAGGIKTYGSDVDSFRCCDGTALENHTKYQESIYFYSGDTLYVNLFIPSQLSWAAKSMTVRMETRYPNSDTVRMTVTGTGFMAVKIRVPSWLRRTMEVRINGSLQPRINTSGTYVKYNTTWSGSGTIELIMPQSLRFERAPDNANVGGAMYGSQLLAGRYGANNLASLPTLNAGTVAKVTSDTLLSFTGTATPANSGLIPYYRMHGERYAAYWTLTNVPPDTFVTATLPGNNKPVFFLPHVAGIKIIKGKIVIFLPSPLEQDQFFDIRLFSLNGVLVAQVRGIARAGERYASFGKANPMVPNGAYICSISFFGQTYKYRLLIR